MRSEILVLLAASHFAQAIPIPFLESSRLSPRWFQDSALLPLVQRSPHRHDHRDAATSTGDVTFVDPSGKPLATVAASEINPQGSAPTSSTSVVPDAASGNGSSSTNLGPATPTVSGMVGIVPAVGNNPGSSPPLTEFDSLPVPGSSRTDPVQNSTSIAQAAQSSQSTAVASGGMVGIVPAVGNNPGSSPPLTAFPSIPAANPNSSPTPAASNRTVPSPTGSTNLSVIFTTVMITVTTTRSPPTSSATPIVNSTSVSTTPAPIPAAATTSGSSGDTFPLISSQPPATAASAVSPSPSSSRDSMKDTFGLGPTTSSPPTSATPIPTNPGTLFSFSPSGFSSISTTSTSPMLVLPSIQTVSPTDQSTITIDPPSTSTLAPQPVAGANSPQSPTTSLGSAAVATPAAGGVDGLSIVPLGTPGANGTGAKTGAGTGAKTGGVAPDTVTVTVTPTPTPTPNSTPSLLLAMSSTTLTIPLPG